MNTIPSFDQLSDHDLLAQVRRATRDERHATAHLIALLMKLDARKLYRREGCSSLFIEQLHLSEHAAYLRIEAARAAQRFPLVLERLADGSTNLTNVGLLAPHLTASNHQRVLDEARHKRKSLPVASESALIDRRRRSWRTEQAAVSVKSPSRSRSSTIGNRRITRATGSGSHAT